jgi:hypothetical protein
VSGLAVPIQPEAGVRPCKRPFYARASTDNRPLPAGGGAKVFTDEQAKRLQVGICNEVYTRESRNSQGGSARVSADAIAGPLTECLRYLQQAVPDERPVDIRYSYSVKSGLHGVKAHLTLLAVSENRVWHLNHDQGILEQPTAVALQEVTISKKRLILGLGWKEKDGRYELQASGSADHLQAVKAGSETGPSEGLASIMRGPASPVASTPAASSVAGHPAGWSPDPAQRHELRWWDGEAWSPHVSDSGVVGSDPL